ncbi:hypothetical protein [Bosea sp. BH3]|uniref:hypothetical protein n=1 Tax=Bosea sp. BH3 TaxID=2871701 RepID=UPI0021CAEBE3|nr:hypothetical protein [Bosea sp. BH3]MCU4180401.1 hypothetical protein [Bosea sp. BH3]
MSGEIGLLWLVDADPPSEAPGGRGFYPANGRTDPPDERVMVERLNTAARLIAAEAGGRAVVTIHTSPRHREHLFAEPYAGIWQGLRDAGTDLALHPHEERLDGRTHYGNLAHMRGVVEETMEAGRRIGIDFTVFRSGGFAFHDALPALLAQAGIRLDCSAAPGHVDASRDIAWPDREEIVLDAGEQTIVEVPLGWNGEGTDLSRDYLFNERQDLDGLKRVWDAIRQRFDAGLAPPVVNFLTHGFGLVAEGWRDQALRFLDHARRNGARLISAAEAEAIVLAHWARQQEPTPC